MKYDIRRLTLAADNLLETNTNPRHRRILSNYRRHAMLEVSGRYEEIFTPEMTVEHPFYRISSADGVLELDGLDVRYLIPSWRSSVDLYCLIHSLISVSKILSKLWKVKHG